MANVSRVNGFRPVKTGGGSPWNGQATKYAMLAADGTAAGIGDLVKIAGTADADGVRAVTKASVGDAVVGAIVAVLPNPASGLDTPQYRLASTLRYVLVCDDPYTVYECQHSGTVAAADVGLNANHADAGITTTTGTSGETLDGSTKAATATLTLKILDFVQRPDNEVGANAKLLVKINNHQLASSTGTAGV